MIIILSKVAKEFEGQLESPGENKERYKKFSVPIKKEITKTDKDGNESIETISYKIKFIDGARFMVHKDLWFKIKGKDCDCFLEYASVKDDLIKYKCLSCNKSYSNKLNEELK